MALEYYFIMNEIMWKVLGMITTHFENDYIKTSRIITVDCDAGKHEKISILTRCQTTIIIEKLLSASLPPKTTSLRFLSFCLEHS